MSLELIRTIRCDHILPDGEQCDRAWGAPTEQPTTALLRAHLKSSGWHRTRADDICPTCWTATHPDPKDHPMSEIVYAVHHPRPAFPGETWRASYGARHEAPTDLGAFAAELADDTRIAHSWTGPLTVSLWPPREDEHYGLPVPSNAAVFTFPAVEDPR